MRSKHLVLIAHTLTPQNIERIKQVSPDTDVVCVEELPLIEKFLPDATIFVGELDPRLLPLARNLKWVHLPWAGLDKILYPEFVKSEIILTSSKGLHKHQMTEHLFAMILTFSRRLMTYSRFQVEKRWDSSPFREFELLHGKTLGTLGVGTIGSEMARAAKAFGMRVVGMKRDPSIPVEHVDVLIGPESLSRLLRESDHIVVVLPLTKETRSLIAKKEFDLMERAPYFYNFARGAIVHEDDLISALREGKIKGAGLDVFEEEPLPPTSPLWEMENVIITPHVAGLIPHYMREALGLFIENLRRYLGGEELLNVVNKARGY